MPKCVICKEKFVPQFSSLEKCCRSIDCRTTWALGEVKKKKEREIKKQKTELKEKLKTLSQYESEAKKSFQKFIRLRDSDKPCISCGVISTELWDGGHYKKEEIYSGVIFNEMNCHKQCRKCNRFLNGNELNYRDGLISRYGIDYVTTIELKANETRNYKYTKAELIAKKLQYDLKIKELIKNK